MCCTENESSPFVVFFLPAVVGCLTVLLARRWASSQVTSTSTAVSRRRKIIKDPLIKRPLPPVTCKMAPPPKKSSLSKKGSASIPDEETNGGSKKSGKAGRITNNAINTPIPEVKLPEGPIPPKHIPFPQIPQDGEVLFEVMSFIFTLVATGLQFLNIYRTTWWLPNSYTNEAMHFHLIDPLLVAFIITVLSRRVLPCVTVAILNVVLAPKYIPQATSAAKMFILGVTLGALAWCGYFISVKYTLMQVFYLFYPIVLYISLFGFQVGPFQELNNTVPLHCCHHEPQQIRAEVDAMRHDFNMRVKKILFNSIVGAYYSSFIPCCFAQEFVYYDIYASSQQTAFVWGALVCRLGQALLSRATDPLHRAAKHLGLWHHSHDSSLESRAWCESRVYSVGCRVSCPGGVAVGAAAHIAAVPGDKHHTRFYSVFANPSMLLCLMLCLQLSLIVLQLLLLFSSFAWHHFMSIILLLFMNYYTLFKMLRDYLIAWKVYKAESMIQERNGTAVHN